jgi:dTDP-4-amino-4,6-dideoxygalactose transaminase
MEVPFLDLSRMDSELKQALKEKFNELLEIGRFSGGDEVDIFERRIGEKLKSEFSVSCANGTDALELALRALDIGAGDEVIVPAMTWVSTAEAVVMVGAKPIFWDTDKDGLLASDWTRAISQKTKAVIPVHLYGKMPNMNLLIDQAKENQLFVIEDAAQAFGSFQKGKSAGTWGDIGCLSFYPTKNIGALGEAGMCLTSSSELAKKIRLLSNHGQPSRDKHDLVGRNSRIDTIQAGFLNVILDFFENHKLKRNQLASIYCQGLESVEGLKLPEGMLEEDHNAHLFVIQTPRRNALKSFLSKNGISTAIHYPMIVPDMPPFFSNGAFEKARLLASNALSLPLNPYLSEREVLFILSKIKEFFQGRRDFE